ncbi:MAG: hypothetical protein IPP47_22805 [Bryobacterales bacterium]|nr:hypothetical protein [Bryobacterales bacterium]
MAQHMYRLSGFEVDHSGLVLYSQSSLQYHRELVEVGALTAPSQFGGEQICAIETLDSSLLMKPKYSSTIFGMLPTVSILVGEPTISGIDDSPS